MSDERALMPCLSGGDVLIVHALALEFSHQRPSVSEVSLTSMNDVAASEFRERLDGSALQEESRRGGLRVGLELTCRNCVCWAQIGEQPTSIKPAMAITVGRRTRG